MCDDRLGFNGSVLLISLDYQEVNFALRPTLTLSTTDFRLVLSTTDRDDIKHCCVFRFVHV